MTRLFVWILMSWAGAAAAFYGAITWDTALVGTITSGVALFVHAFFGEGA